MTNRYLNMPGSDIIKDSYGKISAAFDAVQADMDGRLSNMFRQSIINGNFDVWQRGIASTNPAISSFLADRWQIAYASTGVLPTSIIHSKQPLVPGDIPGAAFLYRINPNGAGSGFGAGDSYGILQKIENGTRYLCGLGKKITISFWAKSDIPGKRIGVHSAQFYGTGGSPSAQEILVGKIITLTPTWTRYSLTITTNSLNGKTFGTNFDDVLSVNFNIMFGSDFALTRYGTATSETFGGGGSVDIAQVQVNAGDVALPFQPRSFAEELVLCQRYYERIDASTVGGGRANLGTAVGNTSTNVLLPFLFKTQKRIFPSLTQGGAGWRLLPGGIFIPTLSIVDGTLSGVNLSGNYSSGGLTIGSAYLVQSVDGSTSWIAFDAEL